MPLTDRYLERVRTEAVPVVKERFGKLAFREYSFVDVTDVRLPFVPERLVANRLVEVVFVPVALVHVRFVADPERTVKLVAYELVEVVFVPVALVQTRLVKFALAPDSGPLVYMLVNVAFVAKRFCEFKLETVPDVALSNEAYTLEEFRLEIVPLADVSVLNIACEEETREAVRLVVVTEPSHAFQRRDGEPRVKARSTDGKKFPVEVPPANWMSLVVTFPRFVTDWSVSVELEYPVTWMPFT
jgi:hypothetical protein